MKIPQPIPYQGSKRNIARFILSFFPHEVERLVEPFAGSAAVSIAAACYGKASRFYLNDINRPLMKLLQEIIDNPRTISDEYEKLWNEQRGQERQFYYHVRDEFNRTQRPACLLYLLARCVKASVRYNSRGEFNQSPDNRRKGRRPQRMRDDIFATSHLLRGRTLITSKDYAEVLESVAPTDLVYMDPPYQGVCNGKDPRYYTGIDIERFIHQLEDLNARHIPFILSHDGRTGWKTYGTGLPPDIGAYRIEIRAGRSAQATLLGRNDITYESIYISEALLALLDLSPTDLPDRLESPGAMQQRALLAQDGPNG